MSQRHAAVAAIALACAIVLASPDDVITQGQAPLVPQPFPGAGSARPGDAAPPPSGASTQAPPSSTPAGTRQPQADPAPLGTPVYPAAEFIDSYDAGSGQRYYLYGTNTPFADIVTYYRNLLKNGGRELYKTPPVQQFDLGRYQEDAMAYPPSVTVKDYTWNGSPGYLSVSGVTEKRYKTIIQIVPVTLLR